MDDLRRRGALGNQANVHLLVCSSPKPIHKRASLARRGCFCRIGGAKIRPVQRDCVTAAAHIPLCHAAATAALSIIAIATAANGCADCTTGVSGPNVPSAKLTNADKVGTTVASDTFGAFRSNPGKRAGLATTQDQFGTLAGDTEPPGTRQAWGIGKHKPSKGRERRCAKQACGA